jgi:hypothetical protein
MHMLQLYIAQWHMLSSLTPAVTLIHGEWTHWSGIADCTTVIQHWASTYRQRHSMNNIHVRHHTSLYVYKAFIRNNYYRRTHITQNRHARCAHIWLDNAPTPSDRHSSMTGTASIYWSYQHTNIHRIITIVIQYHLWHITILFMEGRM